MCDDSRHYIPKKFLLDVSTPLSDYGQDILDRFPDIPVEETVSIKKTIEDFRNAGGDLTSGKEYMLLTSNKGRFFEMCPGATRETLCCNYFTLNWGTNCDRECTYCFLQGYLNNPFMTVYTNLPVMLDCLADMLDRHPDHFFRIGAGEFSDSLSLDPVINLTGRLVPFFAQRSNALLELKTKTTLIDRLLKLPHHGKVLVSWSLNTQTIQEHEEFHTAAVEDRLRAARACIHAGYQVAFHLDPLIHHDNWQQGYAELIRCIYGHIPPESISWISLGSLRFRPELKTSALKRFPRARIFGEEFVRDRDGKYRYPRKLRESMQRFVIHTIRARDPHARIYLCMEPGATWNATIGFRPESAKQVDAGLRQAITAMEV